MRLQKDLYIYLWENPVENNCNSYVITGDVTVLIDPGHSAFLNQLFEQMGKDGLSPDAIDLIITTHSHPDHMEALEAFLEKGVTMAMSQEEERYLLQSGKLLFDAMSQPFPKIRTDVYLKEGRLYLGRTSFDILQTPGHSPGSLSIHWPDKKALFTGDVVFFGGIGRTDFVEGDSRALMESIERLSALETEILLPGHGEILVGRDEVLRNFQFIRENIYAYL
jgi:hydroxyacylglutathione hydrolase